MIRTQISLDRADHERLTKLAEREGVSMSSLIRDAVAELLRRRDWEERKQRLLRHAGKYRSGLGDVGVNHDKYLNEGERW
jgi:hypothetical protein